MNLQRELLFVFLIVIVITWNVALGYYMVNYVNEINKVNECRSLAVSEGNIIQVFGSLRLLLISLLLIQGFFSIIVNLVN